ncbi:hypothetical protein [Pseudonocardia acaciae]|uniref:hypothetical protein n=1 Tax=Pseudonocardia acaciae TaxID=551276 RepID=UPI00048F4254|nr:hypothetical protein [Pseudonocardia acaciae]
MLAAPAADDPQVVVSVSPTLLIAALIVAAAALTWAAAMTGLALRRPLDDGEPVYRRLPNGRIRFSWVIASQLAAAQRHATEAAARATEPDTEPLRPVPPGSG